MTAETRYAPVVVFCYNRPHHLKRTIEALLHNSLASRSRLFVFSDGCKGEGDREAVSQVRQYVRSITGFREVIRTEAGDNKGLARSVIEGVTAVIREEGSVIVLEDDMVTTPDFLGYMNTLLKLYENRKDIFSVTGYAPPIRIPEDYDKDFYLAPRSSSWGWATWADRWEKADWTPESYKKLAEIPGLKQKFTSGGNDLWPMLVKQQLGVVNSWAVRWILAQARNNGYGVYPVKSKVKNIGADGTGTHFTFRTNIFDVSLYPGPLRFDPGIGPDQRVIRSFARFYNLSLYLKIKNRIKYGV